MSKRTKLLLSIGVIAALVISLQVAAFAVHEEVFQLEGDAVDNATSPPDDWENVFDGNSSADATAFVPESSKAETIFTGGGSKDPEDIPSWKWKNATESDLKPTGSVPDKTNIRDSFAALYNNAGGQKLLYFGADRFDGSGDAAIAFWFFQNPVNTVAGSPGTFSGTHKNGDVLVISNFSNGGVVSTITVYEWNTTCTKAGVQVDPDGNGPRPTLTCGAANLLIVADSQDANCDSPNPDSACAIVNDANDDPEAPWPFTDKDGNTEYLPGEFFEGGVNLTALGLGASCFSTALAETRTSTSPTSVLKDFTIGAFGQCGSTTTTPKDNAGNTIGTGDATTGNPADPISIGAGSVQVKDFAAITVTGGAPTWSGNVQFFLCKVDGTALCTSGGEPIGGNVAVSNTTPTATSAAATVTAAGRYCWRAVFSGDETAGVAGSSDSRITECFKVNPVTPTLSTTAGPDVNLGNAVTDTATLTGTATQPGTTNGVTDPINPTTAGLPAGGTITFKLYASPSSGTGCGSLVFTSDTFTVSGDRNANTTPSSYGPASFTPTAPGTYHWVAEYSGNSPNTNGASHNAPDPNTAGSGCTDANETVVVNQLNTTIDSAQRWVPNDTATLNHGGPPGYSVTFTLLKDVTLEQCKAATPPAGSVIYGPDPRPVSGSAPFTATSNNSTAVTSVDPGGDTYTWKIEVPATGAFKAATSCVETTAFTSLNNGGTVTSD